MTKRITATSDAGMYYDIYIRRPRKLNHGVLDFNVFWGNGASVNINVPLDWEWEAYGIEQPDDFKIRNSAHLAITRLSDWYPHFLIDTMAIPKKLLDNIYKELEEYFTKELKRFKKELKLNKEN